MGVSVTRGERLSGFASYTLQAAVFGTDLMLPSRFHPLADDTEIHVAEGSSLPGIPLHSAKFGVAARLASRLDTGFTVKAQSSAYLRGDEANALLPIAGLAIADALARYRLSDRLSLLAQVTNLFDSQSYTFGVLGEATLLDDDLERARFYSPVAPRAAWVGIDIKF